MPGRKGGDDEIKFWKGVLLHLAGRKGSEEFTAGDVAAEVGVPYAAAAQLLKRLQVWGDVRVVGFSPAVRAEPNPKKGGSRRGAAGGRQRKVYILTDHGKKKAAYIEREAS